MDICGLRCLVLVMLTGKQLLSCMPNREDFNTLQLSSGLSNYGKDFLKCYFSSNPKSRWTADMFLQHPFLDMFSDSDIEITSSLEGQFLDLSSNEDEDEEDVNITSNAFLNLLREWTAWLEENV